jgi:hypothetical protein
MAPEPIDQKINENQPYFTEYLLRRNRNAHVQMEEKTVSSLSPSDEEFFSYYNHEIESNFNSFLVLEL